MNASDLDLYERIAAFPLDDPDAQFPFTARLARENGWSLDYARRVVAEYKRFAFLAVAAGHPVSPSDAVDQAWHLHLTYTRSYWERFCPEALGMALHHHPTTGGRDEAEKFTDWYARTVWSYRRFFGEDPPEDVWPAVTSRRGEDAHRRVDARRNWVVPKAVLGWMVSGGVCLLVCFLLAALWAASAEPTPVDPAPTVAPTGLARGRASPVPPDGGPSAVALCLCFTWIAVLVIFTVAMIWSAPVRKVEPDPNESDPSGSTGGCGGCGGCGGGCGGCCG